MEQYLDSKGKVHYLDDNGNEIKGNVSLLNQVANNLKAMGTNFNSWINETNPESTAYKQKVNTALALTTLPMGAGAKATQAIAKPLVPYVGKQIAENVAQGVGAGAVSGGVEGVGRGLIEGENPILTGVTDSLLGATFGGLGGFGAGQFGKYMAKKNLVGNPEAQMNFYDDYLEGLNNNAVTKQGFGMNDIRGLRTGNYGNLEGETLYNFIGENAENADRVALNKAQELFNQGIDNESVRQQTGWFKGVDGKWRYEIPYGELYEHPEFTEWSDIYGRGQKSYSIKLKDLYNNPELYKNYPELGEMSVYFDKMPNANGVTDYESIAINQDLLPIENPKYMEELNKIKNTDEYKKFNNIREKFNNNEISYDEFGPIEDAFNNSALGDRYNDLLWDDVKELPRYLQKGNEEKLRRTLIHEIQHNIQNKEGFAVGGDPSATEDYMKLAGEVEARLAARRSLLRKPGELTEFSPLTNGLSGYDVAPEQQIVKFDNNGSFDLSSEDNALVEKLNQMSKDMKKGKYNPLNNNEKSVKINNIEGISKADMDYLTHELNNNLTKKERARKYIKRPVGDYVYKVKNNGFNEYEFMEGIPIDDILNN